MRRCPVKGIRATEDEWKKCIAVFLRERTIARMAEELGRSHCLAERMAMRLRLAMAADVPEPFHGLVEMDETYIGGQRKNKRLHIRRIAAKKGHGTDKLPIVGLFDRAAGSVFVVVEPRKLDIAFVIRTIRERVVPGAWIHTDGFKMYRNLKGTEYWHAYVDHAGGEYVRGDVHTNNIEGFWGILKRKLGCIGGMRRKYLHLFVAEIVWKFNRRRRSLKDQERALAALVFRS
jgi:transposase-like protein